jgi:hypothetical protein
MFGNNSSNFGFGQQQQQQQQPPQQQQQPGLFGQTGSPGFGTVGERTALTFDVANRARRRAGCPLSLRAFLLTAR